LTAPAPPGYEFDPAERDLCLFRDNAKAVPVIGLEGTARAPFHDDEHAAPTDVDARRAVHVGMLE
jgi:hypothetical protein